MIKKILPVVFVILISLLNVVPVLADTTAVVTVLGVPQFGAGIFTFNVIYTSDTRMDLNWTVSASTANVMVRAKYGQYPANPPDINTAPSDGYLVYYGSGLSAVDTSMDMNQNAGTLYYTAWAQNIDGTWNLVPSKSAKESRELILLAFIGLALGLTVICFVWHNILLALAGMLGWLVPAGYIIFGGDPAIDMTTTWGMILVFLFVILCFVPLVRYISKVGKTQVTHRDKEGKMWSLWEKPPKPVFVKRAEQVREKRRQEIRSAIERAQSRRNRP
jgi:hypothetical protein